MSSEWGRIIGGPVIREGFIPGRYPPTTWAEEGENGDGPDQIACRDPAECLNGPFPHHWHTSCQHEHDSGW